MELRVMGATWRLWSVIALSFVSGCGSVRLRSPIAPVAGPPSTFTGTTSDSRGSRVVELRDGLTKQNAFKAVVAYLNQKYTVDVKDDHAGFIMTPWQASSLRNGVPDLRYRTRVIVRFIGDEWKQVTVRSEANWQHGDGWDIGFDEKLLDDVATEILNRIGKK